MTDDRGTSICPDLEVLRRFLCDEHPADAVVQHVDACPDCQATLERLPAGSAFLTEFVSAMTCGVPTEGELRPAETLPGFDILREIHRGGQGIVYEAWDTRSKRQVALKMLRQGALATSRQRSRFEREIEIVARLRHPNIVTLYESGVMPGRRLGYVMEYVDGGPLDEACRRRWSPTDAGAASPRATIRAKVELFLSICDAIRYAHEHGVLHRDLKPDNILVDAAGVPRVLDFGLAKNVASADAAPVTVTQTGEIFGTFAYASPEHVSGDPEALDTRSDVYALGVILYEMLCNDLPYRPGSSMQTIVHTLTRTPPTAPSKLDRGIDGDLETIILRCLAKEPDRRYRSAGALRDDLGRYLEGYAIDARRDSAFYVLRKTAARHRFACAGFSLFFLTVSTLAVAMSFQARQLSEDRDRIATMLAASNVERGRLLAKTASVPAAEEMLWEELIEHTPVDGRSFETALADDVLLRRAHWALCDLYADQPCLMTFVSETGVSNFDITDDRLVVLEPGSLVVVDIATGRRELERSVPADTAELRLSPDGALIATAAEHGSTIQLWHADDLSSADAIAGVGETAYLRFSPDATRLAIGGVDGTVTVWDVEVGRIVAQDRRHESSVLGLAFGADGRALASWCERRGVVRGNGGVMERDFDAELMGMLEVKPDAWTVVLDAAGAVELRAWPDGVARRASVRLNGRPTFVQYAPGLRRFLSYGQQSAALRMWNLDSDDGPPGPGLVLHGHGERVVRARLVPDGERAASMEEGRRSVRVYQTSSRRAARPLPSFAGAVHAVWVDPRGRWMAIGGINGRLELRDAGGESVVWGLETSAGVVSSIAFAEAVGCLVAGGYDGVVRFYDVTSGRLLNEIATDGAIHSIAVAPDGRVVAVPSRDGGIGLWSLPDGAPIAALAGHEARVPCLRFTPDGRALISAGMDGGIHVWDTTTWVRLAALTDRTPVAARSLAISPDGRTLLVGNDHGEIEVWDVATWGRRQTVNAHGNNVFDLVYSADGAFVVSGARNGEIKLWDADGFGELAELSSDNDERMAFSLAFSPDGRFVFAAGQNELLMRIDLRYYERHLAGNVAGQLARSGIESPALRAWAASVLAARAQP